MLVINRRFSVFKILLTSTHIQPISAGKYTIINYFTIRKIINKILISFILRINIYTTIISFFIYFRIPFHLLPNSNFKFIQLIGTLLTTTIINSHNSSIINKYRDIAKTTYKYFCMCSQSGKI